MTAQSMLTIVAPLAADKIDQALASIKAMGNPASPDVAAALDRLDGDFGVHFTSLHAIAPTDPKSQLGHLVLELSADGDVDVVLKFVVARIGDRLAPIFALSTDKPGADLAAYFKSHVLNLGVGWTGHTGLPFSGAPGASVGRIRREATLGVRLAAAIEAQGGGVFALERLASVRAAIRADAAFAWALEDPHVTPPAKAPVGLVLLTSMAFDFAKTFLWPLLVPLAVVAIFGLMNAVVAISAWASGKHDMLEWSWATMKFVGALFSWLVVVSLAFAIPLMAVALTIYFSLRAKEQTDALETAAPSRTVLHQMLAGENHYAQNHMVSITQRKPGITRRITASARVLDHWRPRDRAQFAKPGSPRRHRHHPLRAVGSCCRAVGTSCSSPTSAVAGRATSRTSSPRPMPGLTAVWSNTVGFPRHRATCSMRRRDRWGTLQALRSPQHDRRPHSGSAPTPTLTTDNIRTNAAVRNGPRRRS